LKKWIGGKFVEKTRLDVAGAIAFRKVGWGNAQDPVKRRGWQGWSDLKRLGSWMHVVFGGGLE
jgi:hypothetical protein